MKLRKNSIWTVVLVIIMMAAFIAAVTLVCKTNQLKNAVDQTMNEARLLEDEMLNKIKMLETENTILKSENISLKAQTENLLNENEQIVGRIEALEMAVGREISLDFEELWNLLKITQCEARGESLKGKAAVASVILNRVKDPRFPNTITSVIYDGKQFQPVITGSIDSVETIDTETFEAVLIALEGTDYSNGALYFYNPKISAKKATNWFDTLETTTEIGNHRFKVN